MSGIDSLQCEYRQGGVIIRAPIDLREVLGEATFMDRFGLGEQAGRHLPRIPSHVLMHEHMADPQRIGKIAARNRGIEVEVFTAPAHAEAWFTACTWAG